jgi:RNA polymerase sigma-70 factor, ECF subfamily
MAFTATALPAAPWQTGLPLRLDALISALLRVQITERMGPRVPRLSGLWTLAAEAEPYQVTPLRITQRVGGTRRVQAPAPQQQDHEPDESPVPDEPQLIDTASDTAALIREAQAGDPEAFGQLYDRYVDLVHRYIYYRVGSQALAEDLTSETFLRALRRITSYTSQGVDIGAWFVTIARNLVADHYKSGRYRLEVQVQEVRDDRTLDGPEDEVLDSLDHRMLLEAVTKLGSEQQECIVLRFMQGLSVSETALAMGKNEGAIKALQYRAVRSLSRLLPEGFVR